MEKVNKKTIILVAILVLILFVLGLIFAFTKKPTTSLSPSTSSQGQYTENDKAMPWNIAVSFIGKGLVEKIEVIDQSSIRLFLKDESTPFIINEPSQNAYIDIIRTSPNPISIVK